MICGYLKDLFLKIWLCLTSMLPFFKKKEKDIKEDLEVD